MPFKQNLQSVFAALRQNKRRTFLTMLGMVISIAAVIAINSAGAGAQSLVFNQIKSMGSNLIGILPGGSEEEGPPASIMGIVITTLTNEDAEALANKNNLPHIESVTAYVRGQGTLSWREQTADVDFNGVSENYIKTEETAVATGSFFSPDESRNLSRVMVLGSGVKEDLFGDQNPIGQIVKLKKENFRVIGVMKKRGSAAFQNYDQQVFLPLETAQKILLGINHISMIRTKVDAAENIPTAIEQIKKILRDRHNINNPLEDDFTVRNQVQALDILKQITDALRLFITAIAAIGLLVGGIGIMNIMLIAVNERVREIGLRKAVGATSRRILWQYLWEALTIALVAGILGIIVGTLLAALAALIIRQLGYDWDLVISWQSIVTAILISSSIGLVFGLYPARRAARLEAVEALRYE